MNTNQILEELSEIAQLYPTLRGLLNIKLKSGSYVGQQWAMILKDCDPDDLHDVCQLYATAKLRIPNPTDHLVFEIADRCKELADKRLERLRSMEIQAAGRSAKRGDLAKYVREHANNPDHVIFTGIPGVNTVGDLMSRKEAGDE